MKSVTTLVAVVSGGAADAVAAAARAAINVAAEQVGELPSDPVQASALLGETWSRAATHSAIYTLVNADPLAVVVAHWAARLQDDDHDLEVAIGLSGSLAMPDYYLVDTDLTVPAVHWYLGLTQRLAPARVAPVEMNTASLLRGLLPFLRRPFSTCCCGGGPGSRLRAGPGASPAAPVDDGGTLSSAIPAVAG